jgi:hypothetical protein
MNTLNHTCADLALCQWRNPACDTCPNTTAPLAVPAPAPAPAPALGAVSTAPSMERLDEAPTWTQVFKSWLPSRDACWGTALFVALFATYACIQNSDDAATTAELARAQQLGYHKGYNTGSSAGLKAAHNACVIKMHINPNNCDWILSNAMVAYADEVKP